MGLLLIITVAGQIMLAVPLKDAASCAPNLVALRSIVRPEVAVTCYDLATQTELPLGPTIRPPSVAPGADIF